MPIPDFQTLMLPVLRSANDGEAVIGAVVESLADALNLSENDRTELLPSGRQTTFANRVHWAKSYLGKAGLVELTGRGRFRITDRGRSVLQNPPARIDLKFLSQFPEFRISRGGDSDARGDDQSAIVDAMADDGMTPDEIMRRARSQLEAELGQELIRRVIDAKPAFFERLVVSLLVSMGYGGSAEEAGKALGRSGDGGVDGVIDQDALGLDRIYIQAKRYADGSNIGPGAIRDFFGSLDRFKASKGVFVTTSAFSNSARETAEYLSKRIVLVDGQLLARLMIRYGVGCRVEETLHIKRIDEEFFQLLFH